MPNFQEEIDQNNISEKDLEDIGWVRVCGNLPRILAEQMISVNPDRVIVQDDLNPFMWVVMMKGVNNAPAKNISGQEGTDTIREDAGQVSDTENRIQA